MLTPRQEREQEFYNQFSHDKSDMDVDFEPADVSKSRPWNSYWFVFQQIRDAHQPGAKLLDVGCGWGENSMLFAKMGYEVHGFDISPGNLQAADALAEKYELSRQTHFSRQVSEALEYDDNMFDVIVGIDILHHVQIKQTAQECLRVLKPGGFAIFKEPFENRVFDGVRNLSIVRKLVPNEPSQEKHITPDERKLNHGDLRTLREVFGNLQVDSFRVISRLSVVMPATITMLEKVDRIGCKALPGYKWLRGTVVLTMHKQGP